MDETNQINRPMDKTGNSSVRFAAAIVRTPGRSIVDGVTTAELGKPDYHNAVQQHRKYIEALEHCGVRVTVMASEEKFPDSVFVEDCAVLTDISAVIANTSIVSRKGEEASIRSVLGTMYKDIREIKAPGTLEGGDVLRVNDHFYIGLTARTNETGARQLITIPRECGYTASTISVNEMLHLKTGAAFLGDDTVVLTGELIDHPAFVSFKKIIVDNDESYAANCVRINDYVVMPAGYIKTKQAIQQCGYEVLEVDVSEFRKVDGGISCLSLRIPLTKPLI